MTEMRFLERGGGEKIAFRKDEGRGPGIVWVGGFRSDMTGTKAEALSAWAQRHGRASLRFDYFGHGASSGDFADGTVNRWRDDALAAFDALSEGPQVVIGSSMGGWIATLLARARTDRIAALVLLAPAPDFTETLMWALMPEEVRREIVETGRWLYRSEGDSYPITKALIESGRENLLLDGKLEFPFPVRIIHGMADREVPWQQTLKLVDAIQGDVRLTLVKHGEHRLSTPSDLKLIEQTLDVLFAEMP